MGEPFLAQAARGGRRCANDEIGGPNRDTGFSCTGESLKISDKDNEDEFDLVIPLPNLKGGGWLSGAARDGKDVVLENFDLESDGRRGPDLLLSGGIARVISTAGSDSAGDGINGSGVGSGVGDRSCRSRLLP